MFCITISEALLFSPGFCWSQAIHPIILLHFHFQNVSNMLVVGPVCKRIPGCPSEVPKKMSFSYMIAFPQWVQPGSTGANLSSPVCFFLCPNSSAMGYVTYKCRHLLNFIQPASFLKFTKRPISLLLTSRGQALIYKSNSIFNSQTLYSDKIYMLTFCIFLFIENG